MIMGEKYRVKLRWNEIFKEANLTRKRYRILMGSAGSGKSVNVAQDFIKKLSDKRFIGANLLVIRKAEESNRNSTFCELQSAVYRMFGEHWDKVWKVYQNPMYMQNLVTGCGIAFRGVNDASQREKIKSITFKRGKLTWIWIEEATELTAADVDILDDRLRGKLHNPNLYYQITMTFNPVSASHFIKARYFDNPSDDVFTHHSTYFDNRFIDADYLKRMERRKIEDPEGYRVYGLGEWGETEGLILKNYVIHEFDISKESFDDMAMGQDFGFNHANAILLLGYKDGEVYICKEIYEYEKTTADIIKIAEGIIPRDVIMYCDSSEPDRISEWRRAGFRAVPALKGKGSVKGQIDWLKARRIHIHPHCKNTIKEIQQWRWKKENDIYIDEPVCFLDDAMSALRYGIQGWRGYEKEIIIPPILDGFEIERFGHYIRENDDNFDSQISEFLNYGR